MNHYPHHIGDFNSATRHLTFVERALYRELLDLYYDTERPLNADATKLARRVLAHTEEQRAALDVVLEEFFELQEDGWHNARCDREIASYHQKQEQQSKAGKASAAKRMKSQNTAESAGERHSDVGGGGSTPVERPLNGRTTNQNQNQNHIKPPNPPAGGASGGLAIATALSAHFPEHRRTRIAEVAELIASLQSSGEVTGEQLLEAAQQQADLLGKDNGKACPGVLGWLRRKGWLDSAALPAGGGVVSNWAETRTGIEAMGQRVGLPEWEESGYRLLEQYEAEVRRRLAEQGVAA